VTRVAFTNIRHQAPKDFVLFRMGKEFNYLGFNGLVKGVTVFFGPGSYVHDVDGLNQVASQQIPKP
jgi:hypothetical protein